MANKPSAAVLGASNLGRTYAVALATRFGTVAMWEPDADVGRAARGTPGISRVTADLPSTVEGAAVVICTVRRGLLPEVLAAANPHLTHGAVVAIVGIGHEHAHTIASEAVSDHASVVCVTVFPAPAGLGGATSPPTIVTPAAGISPAPSAHPDAVGVVQAIVEASGATAFYGDPREIDAIAAAAIALPVVAAAAIVRATLGTRGARDLDRAGTASLLASTAPLDTPGLDADDLCALTEPLQRLMADISSDFTSIATSLSRLDPNPAAISEAAARRDAWRLARGVPPDSADLPSLPAPSRRRLFF